MRYFSFITIVAFFSLIFDARANEATSPATLSVEPSRSSYLLGEPIILKATFKNPSASPIEIDLGWNREAGISFSLVTPAKGVKTDHPKAPEHGGVSTGPIASIGAGEAYVQYLLLDQWIEFQIPGTYVVKGDVSKSGITVNFPVEIAPPDPELLQKRFMELATSVAFPTSDDFIVVRRALDRWQLRDEKVMEKFFPKSPKITVDEVVRKIAQGPAPIK
jgi:hypothetical protein